MLVGCGRIGFDPLAGGDGNAPGDGTRDAPRPFDAPADAPTACAMAIPISVGVRAAVNTCAGGDYVDGCGPANTKEVVFVFTPSVTAGYQFQAFDPGTNNVSNSTQQLNPTTCKPMGSCAGIFGTSISAGETAYFVVEAAAGGCVNIEFEAM